MARPQDPRKFGVYHALCIAHSLFGGRGFILPSIDAQGNIDPNTAMPYKDYVQHLRQAVRLTGCPEVDAERVAGHSPRSGAATQGAGELLQAYELSRLAGVRDLSWIVGLQPASHR